MPDLETERGEWKHESQFGTFAIASLNIRNAYESTEHDNIDKRAKLMVDCTDSKRLIEHVCKAIAKSITGSQKYCIADDHKSSTLCQDDRMFWQNNNKAFSYPETSEKENSCYMKKCFSISFMMALNRIICLLKEIFVNSSNIDFSEDKTFWKEIIKNLFFRPYSLSETALTDSAFICLSAALGWDNPKQSEYWKSLRDGNPKSVIRSLQFKSIATKFLLQLQLSHDDVSVKALSREERYENDVILLSQFQSSNDYASLVALSVKKVGYKDETNSVEGTENGENLAHGNKTNQNMPIEVILSQSRHDHASVVALSVKKVGYKDETNSVERTENRDNLERGNKISQNMSNNRILSQSRHDHVSVEALSVEKVGYEDETNSVDRTENGDNLERGNKTSQNISNNVILFQSSNDDASVVALSVEEVGYEDETNSVERTENHDNLERGNGTSQNTSNTLNLSQSRHDHACVEALSVEKVGYEDETNSVEQTENSDNSDGLVFMNGEKKAIENLIENQANVLETSDSKKFSKKSAVTRELEVMIEKNKRLFCEKQIPLKNVTSILDCLETFEEGSLEEDPEMIKLMVPPPPRNLQDEKFRLTTFRGLRTQVYAAEEFARGGFYCEHGNVVVCYSCLLQHGIDDIVGSKPSDLQWHDNRCRHALRLRSIPPRESIIDIVEEDGVCSDIVGDPPGQRSFYIPPGDVRMEQYRLSTFEHYPTLPGFLALTSFRRGLAKNGFYFTGFTDRVKCFSCGRSVDKWNESDQTADQKWHKRTCSLKNGLQCDNVPIRFCFGDLLNTNAGHDTVLQQRNHNTGDIRTVRYPQDLPERVRQNGGSFNIGPGNEVQIQSGPVAQPRRGNEDQPRRNVAPNQREQAHQPRGVPEPPREVPTWRMAAVASQDHRRFLTNLFLNRELDRITSYARWPSDRPNVPPAALAKTGFYYLGDMDRVQCFSCGGVLRNWSLDDNAEREHRAHFGGCHMVLGNEPSNLPIPTHPESSQLLAVNYPLRFPQNPHMRGQAQREQTFDRRWPTRALRVNVEEVAEAGFFYLGERDRVKCFYCNGGLQNWEFDDKPWDEHAKWFPNCQFLLRTKGQKFVSYHLAPNAQLARPIIARQDGSPLDRIGRPPVSPSRGHDIPPTERRPSTPPPTIIDPQAEMRERKERVKNIMRNSEVVKNVLTMGFSEQIVETLLIDRIVSNKEDNPNDIYGTVSELLDEVMKKEDEIRQEEEERRDQTQSIFSNPSAYSSMSTSVSTIGPAPGSGKYNVSYYGDDEDMNDVDMYGEGMEGTSYQGETAAKQLLNGSENTESLQSQMDKIEEERVCKICLSAVADMVFLPCSHMLCCMECTQAIKHCPVCRKRIERAIKTYVK